MLHWTAGDYATVFPSYHVCLSGASDVIVHATHDLRANMRDVRADPETAYAAHTQGRNSYCAGIAVCAMAGATPHDFGGFPLTEQQLDALCRVTAVLVERYAIPLEAVRTHAEAALEDGYFGAGDDARWDIARLAPARAPLEQAEAGAVGTLLRARIARRL
jgi:hypothetical protein